jgi:hypothetical protein
MTPVPNNGTYPRLDVRTRVVKICSECSAEAPIGSDIDHDPACSGSPNICTVENRTNRDSSQ